MYIIKYVVYVFETFWPDLNHQNNVFSSANDFVVFKKIYIVLDIG